MMKFNREGFTELLEIVRGYHELKTVSWAMEALDSQSLVEHICLLRHDIDYCLEYALTVAKLEESLGVISTFYLLVDSEQYNICSKRGQFIVREISAMGHEIGLHFDSSNYSKSTHKACIQMQSSLLSDITGSAITSMSFHNPSTSGGEINRDHTYCNLYNTYSKLLSSAFVYVSDSLCRFRDEGFVERIESGSIVNLQLLLHPVWWITDQIQRDDKILGLFDTRNRSRTQEYFELLKMSGLQ